MNGHDAATRCCRPGLIGLTIALAGCASTGRPIGDVLTLRVDRYDPASGEYTLTLRNASWHSVLFLHGIAELSAQPTERAPQPIPRSLQDSSLIHGVRLGPRSRTRLVDTCSEKGCRAQPAHVGIYACWFEATWTCERYTTIWSDLELGGR